MNNHEMLKNCLKEMSVTAKTITHNNYKEFINRFDTILAGEKLNKVLSLEVFHYLKRNGMIDTTTDEFTKLVTDVCRELRFDVEGLIATENIGKDMPPIAVCYITLF